MGRPAPRSAYAAAILVTADLGLTNNVLVLRNVSSWYQELIQGLVIVGAVALYKQKRR
jgi:ribose/xylose/arabinose/galactoside ABC-type transport system permease subunit